MTGNTSQGENVAPPRPRRPAIGRSNAATCRCGARWTGLNAAHCSACHRTFASVDGFDAHRRDVRGVGTCVDPATIVHGARSKRAGEPVLAFREGMWRSAREFTTAGALFGGDS